MTTKSVKGTFPYLMRVPVDCHVVMQYTPLGDSFNEETIKC